MLELAEIVRVAGPRYRATHAGRLLPSQQRALDDIVRCRTAALGGAVYECDQCGTRDFAYHSCRNRHCPKCQADRAQRWLDAVRVATPAVLRTSSSRSPCRPSCGASPGLISVSSTRRCFEKSAAALQTIASDPAWVGRTTRDPCCAAHVDAHPRVPPTCPSRRDRGRAVAGRHDLATASVSTFSHAGIPPLGSVSAGACSGS